MKTAANHCHRSATLRFDRGVLALTGVAALIFAQTDATARGGRIVAASAGYRSANNINNDNYGYWYGTGSNTAAASNGGGSSGSSLPSGALRTLPDGAVPVVVFGKRYYFANGNDYSPVFYGGSVIYVIANP